MRSRFFTALTVSVMLVGCVPSGGEPTATEIPAPAFTQPVKIADGIYPSAFSHPRTNALFVAYYKKDEVEHEQHDDSAEHDMGAMNAAEPPAHLFLKRSTDGGKTWTEPVKLNSEAGAMGWIGPTAQISFGPNEEVHVLWMDTKVPDDQKAKGVEWYSRLLLASSNDGGQTFGAPVVVADSPEPDGALKEAAGMATAPDGTVHIAYLYHGGAETDPYQVRLQSTKDSKTFTKSTVVDVVACPCCPPTVTTDANNAVYVAWRKVYGQPKDPTKDNIRDVVVSRSDDGGKSFNFISKTANDNFIINECPSVSAPLAFDSKGRLNVVWYTGKAGGQGIFHAVSTDKGMTWSKATALESTDWFPVTSPDMKIAQDGNVWVTWNDRREVITKEDDSTKVWEKIGSVTNFKMPVAVIGKNGSLLAKTDSFAKGNFPVVAPLNEGMAFVWEDNKAVYFALGTTK